VLNQISDRIAAHPRLSPRGSLTLREGEVVQRPAAPSSARRRVSPIPCSTGSTNAIPMDVLFEALPGQLDPLVDKVIPILQARGLFRTEYEGETFREKISAFPSRQPAHRRAARLLGRRAAVASPRQISKRKDNCVLEMGRAIM
jgi:hypothetical protein